MATANKTMSATKVVIPCRISFANIFEPKIGRASGRERV